MSRDDQAVLAARAALAERLRAAGTALVALGSGAAAHGPWPLAERFDHAAEARWGPAEVLAHVMEFLPYWQGEMERVLDASSRGEPAPFGRLATDEVRLAIIARDRSVPTRELLSRIESDVARLAGRIEQLEPDELQRRGRHPTRGELTVAELLERFEVAHLEEHVDQLRALVGP